jgi:hypothetical protein
MLICGNNALQQTTVHSSMSHYVHARLHNAQNLRLRVKAAHFFAIKNISLYHWNQQAFHNFFFYRRV